MGGSTAITTKTNEESLVEVRELTYEQTLQVTEGESTLNKLADETPFRLTTETSSHDPLSLHDFTFGLFGKDATTNTVTVDDSGWSLEKSWAVTKWDRARYALGIRELSVNANTYGAAGEFVSVPFTVPRPIRKIALQVDSFIPDAFRRNDPLRAWIEFFVSVDDGKTWTAISQLSDLPVESSEGKRIPQIINVNTTIPVEERSPLQGYIDVEQPATSVRIRVRMARPDGQDFDRYSPILKGYKLKLSLGRGIF